MFGHVMFGHVMLKNSVTCSDYSQTEDDSTLAIMFFLDNAATRLLNE